MQALRDMIYGSAEDVEALKFWAPMYNKTNPNDFLFRLLCNCLFLTSSSTSTPFLTFIQLSTIICVILTPCRYNIRSAVTQRIMSIQKCFGGWRGSLRYLSRVVSMNSLSTPMPTLTISSPSRGT
jgi:hypothetical protein